MSPEEGYVIEMRVSEKRLKKVMLELSDEGPSDEE